MVLVLVKVPNQPNNIRYKKEQTITLRGNDDNNYCFIPSVMNLIAAKTETKTAAVLFSDHMIIIKALFLYDKWPEGEESTKMSIDHTGLNGDGSIPGSGCNKSSKL